MKQESGTESFRISGLEVKLILNRILKREMLKFTSYLEEKPGVDDNVLVHQDSKNDMIGQVLAEYRTNFQKDSAQDTFPEMQDLLDLFKQDSDLNQVTSTIRGDRFCEMLALFVDLAECMRNDLSQ